ncbi:hypothetical protein F2Q68_00011862 [Brassica cretica]|uniref:Uncharacterized protein n=1 Tax=Brassica cretica TaxID=69181 RepID=A0A8S9KTT2_BRACR|nr:hypothetical protein F2Q68_00011862 [Brassica cretica]KAF3538040.1 hypothetical protein F2Q69_00024659 [Brassica cretica]
MRTRVPHNNSLATTQAMDETKILVDVKLNETFPHIMALEDKSISITIVDVVHSWLRSKCAKCDELDQKSVTPSGTSSHTTSINAPLVKNMTTTNSSMLDSDPFINELARSTRKQRYTDGHSDGK